MSEKHPIHIVIKSPSGGVWNTARETAKIWARAGYDVRLISVLSNDVPEIEGVKTSGLIYGKNKNRFLKLWGALFSILKFILKDKPEFLVIYSLPLAVLFSLLKPFFKYEFVVVTDMHASAHLKYGRALNKKRSLVFKLVSTISHNPYFYRIVMRRAKVVVAHNHHMIDDLVANFSLKKDKGICVPAFIDKKFFETKLPDNRIDKTILYIGRLTDQKNIEHLIKSFEIVNKKHPDAVLKIAGDGPLENKYRAMTNNPNIQFLGAVSDIRPLQAEANCVVLCSHYEGVSLVMMECLANGLPMVAYDHLSGPIGAIKNGGNGFLVRAYDVQDLSKFIEKSLCYEWNLQSIRDGARGFHPDVVKDQYLAMLRHIQS